MTEIRFQKIKDLLRINKEKKIGWSFSKIGEMENCSGDTVSRVNRCESWEAYQTLLENENKKRLTREAERPEQMDIDDLEVSSPETEEEPIDLAQVINDSISQIIDGLENLRGALLSK